MDEKLYSLSMIKCMLSLYHAPILMQVKPIPVSKRGPGGSSLGMDEKFRLTLDWTCDQLSILELKLFHVSKIKSVNILAMALTASMDHSDVRSTHSSNLFPKCLINAGD